MTRSTDPLCIPGRGHIHLVMPDDGDGDSNGGYSENRHDQRPFPPDPSCRRTLNPANVSPIVSGMSSDASPYMSTESGFG
ncbi:hypothetical protein [Mycobacterium sp. AZCC_0083]|uniref:hypothetical protein n=1 Tax=Mycobacterium sp. AZCC_0083 TaxID=2735882 RepID=UPI00160E14BD|nr:hypothetical protein [Mycobacterium sp. AZCC_0083]MBB5161584.1 hypothetical protein [Mycobacterium sp. AZCC_0083]